MSTAIAKAEPVIERVRFEGDRLVVELSDGRTIGTPIRWYPRLNGASPAERENWELLGRGVGVHWPDVDEDLSLSGMLAGRKAPRGEW